MNRKNAILLILISTLACATAQENSDTTSTPPVPSTSPTTPANQSVPPNSETVMKALEVPKGPPPPPSPPLPPELVLPPPGGPMEEYVGHHKTDKLGSGWGWIKNVTEDWRKARWVSLRENAKSPAPWRALGSKTADEDFEYKVWGYFANHQAYDPIYDEMLDVFVIDHYESLGAAKPLTRRPGPLERFTSHGHSSHAGSRQDRPVQSDDQAF